MEWCWTYMDPRYSVLHHAKVWEPGDEEVWDANALTSCGRRGSLTIPGLFSRMSLPRCRTCCRALGYPPGDGSPKNSEDCRPLVLARIASLRSSELRRGWAGHPWQARST